MEHNLEYENRKKEKKTLVVIIITLITMIAEIVYGYITNSMALLADGYHMGTHALAFSLTFIAYILIRKYEKSDLFPSGTEKIGTLTAYTSSLFLGFTGLWIIFEAFYRFKNPLQIQFNEAILIAVIGLVVNIICIIVMEEPHSHSHTTENIEHKEDYNFKAAYYHILADALTSILAIFALITGKYFNIIYLDPLIGMFGGILILRWAFGLIKKTVRKLVDMAGE